MIERIAVIGLSCLFPGAATPAEFWQNLQAEKDSTFLATAEQMGVDPAIFFEPTQGKAGKTYYLRGGYIQDFTFDATGYHMPPGFLEKLDNLFKWSLYVAKEALRDSGYLGSETVLKKCGVILGNLSFPTKSSQQVLAPIYHRPIETAIRALLENEDFSLANLDSEDRSLYNTMISGYPAAIISQALALSGVSF
jgi:acyl transferase domain-containing protein